MAELNIRQRNFCREYTIDLNATQAALRAGYSKKTAYAIGFNLLKKVEIQAEIKRQMESKDKERVATQDEVLQLLTDLARGTMQEEVVAVEGQGDGYSEARILKRQAAPKDRAKALELLGRRYGLFLDKVQLTEPPVIVDDIPDEG